MKHAALLLLIAATGCAHWTVKRVTPADANSEKKEGLRFYAPELYIWILPAATGGCTATPVYFPNPNKPYVLTTGGLGSTTVKPTLENGWNLTGFEATTDSKTAEVLDAVGGIIGSLTSAIPGAAKEARKGGTSLGVGLYHPETNPTTGVIEKLVPVLIVEGTDGKPASCSAPASTGGK